MSFVHLLGLDECSPHVGHLFRRVYWRNNAEESRAWTKCPTSLSCPYPALLKKTNINARETGADT